MRKKGSGKLKERINNWKIKVSNHNIAVNRLGHIDSYGGDRTSIQTPAVSCGAEDSKIKDMKIQFTKAETSR